MNGSFSCLIPDRPLTRYEQSAVGMTTGDAFSGVSHPAVASFENGEVVVRRTDVADGCEVIAARMPIKDIAEVRISPVPLGKQVGAVAIRSLIVSVGFALAIIFYVMLKTSGSAGHFLDITLPCGLVGGLGMGFLFSFLPSVSQLKRNLLQILLVTPDNQALVLAIRAAVKETALGVFSAHGLKVSDTAANGRSA